MDELIEEDRRKSWFAEPNLFRSPRQDSRRAFGCDRMCSLVYLPLFFTGRHLPDDACRIVFALRQLDPCDSASHS